MKKTTLLFALVAGMFTAATAQIRIAPEAGVSFNKINYDPSLGSSTSFTVGARVGGIVDIPLSDNFYLQPGVAFAMKGSKIDIAGSEQTTNINYIDIPVNVVYKLGAPGENRLFFVLGPSISYGISGKVKYGGTAAGDPDDKITFGSEIGDMKALDFGGNVGVGYEMSMGLYARASYNMGFANLSNVTGLTAKTMGFGLSVGYFFGNKGGKSSTPGE